MLNPVRRVLFAAAVAVVISGCGAVHSRIEVGPGGAPLPSRLAIEPVEVTSAEQHQDALKLNERWRVLADQELRKTLAGRELSPDAADRVQCSIEIRYGNRALRYFAGYGAGAGSVSVQIRLIDSGGETALATKSEAHLGVGLFGGSMTSVVRSAIRKSAAHFADVLAGRRQ